MTQWFVVFSRSKGPPEERERFLYTGNLFGEFVFIHTANLGGFGLKNNMECGYPA
jgi:hypothetical protein